MPRIRNLLSIALMSVLISGCEDETECCTCPVNVIGNVGGDHVFQVCDDTPFTGNPNPNEYEYEWQVMADFFGFSSWEEYRDALAQQGCDCNN